MSETQNQPEPMRFAKEIFETPVEDEIQDSFLAYSLSVITSRAIPDVRDGLKPVQRRILYSLDEEAIRPGTPYKKCARVVGTAMGKFHPHGDSAIYEALVRMAQPFSLRLPLIDGHGNFGSPDDPPAASRYCVTGDARVRLTDGRSVRIDDLAGTLGLAISPDSTIDIDIDVMGMHGEVVHASKLHHSGLHETVELTTGSGLSLQATGNHPVLVLVGDEDHFGFAWKLMDDVQVGDVVAVNRSYAESEGPDLESSRFLGILAGGLAAEGWHTKRVGFNNTDERYFKEVLAAYDALIGGTRYVNSRVLPGGKTIFELDVQDLSAWNDGPLATETGRRSATKRIPECIWHADMTAKRAFLQSAFEGDGSISAQDGGRRGMSVCYYSISQQLVSDIQLLLLEFGIAAYVREDAGRGAWVLTVTNQRDLRLFADRVGFLTDKQIILDNLLAGLTERRDTGGTRGKLSGDHVPFLREFVLSQHHASRIDEDGRPSTVPTAGRSRGKRGREWLTKHNFDRIERFERHGDEIRSHISDDRARYAFELAFRDGWSFQSVASVRRASVEPVYSLRVDTDEHAFITNGLISHNTECRMAHAAQDMVGELKENGVDMRPNYDGTETEPEVLPARIPNLLVNGTTGIAVGMATNIAPHNLREVVGAALALLANPDVTLDELMVHVPGPDFPTGGVIIDAGGIKDAYATGRGAFRIRAKATVGQITAKRRGITITELPYNIGPEKFIARCRMLINQKSLEGIADIKDLSDRHKGLLITVECKTGVNPQAVLAELYQKTPLEESFSTNAVALVKGKPHTLGIKEMLHYYLEHRIEVVQRRTAFRLKKAEDRAHIVEGLVLALASIDEVVELLKKSRDTDTARQKLIKTFKLSDIQAGHILEMPLRRLTGLEVSKLKEELKELKELIKDLLDILAKPERQRSIVGEELTEVAERLGNDRRTRIIGADQAEMPQAALEIADEPCEVYLTTTGLVARPGKKKSKPSRHDVNLGRVETTTRSQVRLLTTHGRLLTVDAVEVPEASAQMPGVPVGDLCEVERDERPVAIVPDLQDGQTLLLATAGGMVKRLVPEQITQRSAQIVSFKGDDRVIGACVVTDDDEAVLVTSDAQLLRFKANSVRPQGRSGAGVAGIKLAADAEVIALGPARGSLWTLTDRSTAKVTAIDDYPAKGRATGGVRCMRLKAGETRLAGALVGDATAVGLTNRGALVPITFDAAKRDATGQDLADAVSLGWA